MKRIIYLTFLTITLQSCYSTHSGIITPSSVQVNQPNFKVVKTIGGTSEVTYILGIGGNSKHGLLNEAKNNMYKSYKMSENQIISNITVDYKNSYVFFPIFLKRTAIISADVISFGNINNKTTSQINENNTLEKDEDIEEKMNVSIDEATIKELSDSRIIGKEYKNIESVIKGDFVSIKTKFGNTIYGKVTDTSIGNGKVVVCLYPSPGNNIFQEFSYKSLLKVR